MVEMMVPLADYQFGRRSTP